MSGRKVNPEMGDLTVKDLSKMIKYAESELEENKEPLKVKAKVDEEIYESDSSESTKQASG